MVGGVVVRRGASHGGRARRAHGAGGGVGEPPPQAAASAGVRRAGARAGPRHPAELVACDRAPTVVERRGLRARQPGPQGRGPGGARELPVPGTRHPAVAQGNGPGDAGVAARGRLDRQPGPGHPRADQGPAPAPGRRPADVDRGGQDRYPGARQPDGPGHPADVPEQAGATVSASSAPALLGAAPPPVRRDPMVLTWLAGTTISAFGDAVWTVALAWTAVQTVSSTLAGAVLGAEMFPQAVLVLLGGVLADRFDPRRILILGQVARALVLALGALAWHAGSDGAVTLFAIALSFGVVAGLTVPSGGPLLREFVHRDDFGTVMGWQQVLGRKMRLLGAPAGGVIVALYGPVAAMVIDGASFAFIALVLALVVRARYAVPRSPHTRW